MEMKTTLVFLCILVPLSKAKLQLGFYDHTCPQTEQIVRDVVQKQFAFDRSITGVLLRSHFVDCVEGGCDASTLIGTTPLNLSTSDSRLTKSDRVIQLIHEAKTRLEATCPKIVSCTDIFTLATRDAVALSGGPQYNIPTGRRDGVSDSSFVNIPGANDPVSVVLHFFQSIGFSTTEAVTLMGAHSVGVAHCFNFKNRLSNFNNTSNPDPNMDPKLTRKLVRICEGQSDKSAETPTAFLDQNTSYVVDNEYYKQILNKRGVMQIDQQFALHEMTAPIVAAFADNPLLFERSFAEVMVKLASSNVIVGNNGEIRTDCGAFNAPKK